MDDSAENIGSAHGNRINEEWVLGELARWREKKLPGPSRLASSLHGGALR